MDKMSIIRIVILIIALTNQFLVVNGMSPIPIDDITIETLVSTIFTVVIALWTTWKNNYISKKGLEQKRVLELNGLYKE